MKSVKIALILLFFASSTYAIPQLKQPIDQTKGNYQNSFGSSGETDGEDLFFETELDNVPSDGDLTLYRKSSSSKTFTSVDTVEAISDYSEQSYHFNVDSEYNIEDGQSSTFTVNSNEHTFELDSVVDSTTVAMYVDGELDNYNLGDDIYVEGSSNSPVTVHDIIDLGSGDGQVTLQKFNRVSTSEGEYSYRVEYKPNDAYSEQIYTSIDTSDKTPYLKLTKSDGKRIRDFNRTEVATLSSIKAQIVEDQGDNYNVSLYNNDNDELVA